MSVMDELLANNARYAGFRPAPAAAGQARRLLGTKEIILIHHTDCGMLTFSDDAFKADIQADTGIRPHWAAEAFDDLEGDVRQCLARIRTSHFIPVTDAVRGFVFDVATGRLTEVDAG